MCAMTLGSFVADLGSSRDTAGDGSEAVGQSAAHQM